jgi:hypothetical protein
MHLNIAIYLYAFKQYDLFICIWTLRFIYMHLNITIYVYAFKHYDLFICI